MFFCQATAGTAATGGHLDQMYFLLYSLWLWFLSLLLPLVWGRCSSAYCIWIMLDNMVCLFSNNNESKNHLSNFWCPMSVVAWYSSATVDIHFKLGPAYSHVFPWFLVGIKIWSQVEPTQTHSEWFMWWDDTFFILHFCFVRIRALFSYFPSNSYFVCVI